MGQSIGTYSCGCGVDDGVAIVCVICTGFEEAGFGEEKEGLDCECVIAVVSCCCRLSVLPFIHLKQSVSTFCVFASAAL